MPLMPNPSYATDRQLGGMAQSGLPSAVNEQIMRASMRGGARMNPQRPPVPGVNQPQIHQPKKLTPKEMIEDFVARVRSENEQSKNSIVPAGTPMQQPQGPDVAAPGQVPKLQNDKAGGIMKYADGGVVRGFRNGGSPTDGRSPLDTPSPMDGLNSMGIVNPYTGRPYAEVKPPVPQEPPNTSVIPPSYDPANRGRWNKDEVEQMKAALGPNGGATGLAAAADNPDLSSAGGSASGSGRFGGPGSYAMPKMGDMQKVGEFKAPDFIDPTKRADETVVAHKSDIDEQMKPFLDMVDDSKTELERSKRDGFWRAILQGGLTAMQAGGPSSDPASGDLMSIAGKSVGQYVASIDKDREYQQSLKKEIRQYQLAGQQTKFAAQNMYRGEGVAAALAQNTNNMGKATIDYQGQQFNAAQQNSATATKYQGEVAVLQQRMQSEVTAWAASLKQKTGMSAEDAVKLTDIASQAASKASDSYLSQVGFSQETDQKKREAMLSRAQAQGVAAASAAVSRYIQITGGNPDNEVISRGEQDRWRAAAGRSNNNERDGTNSIISPYGPVAPKIDQDGIHDDGETLTVGAGRYFGQ